MADEPGRLEIGVRRCWAGIYPTVLTPWRCECGVDEAALEAQIRYQLCGGVHGLLLLGTIGEGEYATLAERAQVIQVAVRTVRGCAPIVVGIHTCDLAVARTQLLQAKEFGADAVLVKYAGNPCASFCDVLAFYSELAATNALPIFYYHYPSQTGLKLRPEEVAQVLLLPGVVGIKESTLDLDETQVHIALTAGHGRTFLSGTALNLTQFMEIGGHGAMCPEAVLLPCLTVEAYHAFIHARHAEARRLQKQLFVVAPLLRDGLMTTRLARLTTMMTQDHHVGLPLGDDEPQARLKAALAGLGICTSAWVKCPLPQLSWRDRHKVRQAVRAIDRLDCSCRR